MKTLFSFLAAIILINGTAWAENRVPFPRIPKGEGNASVHDGVDIRVDHMKFLFHQRDETMYKGIRSKNEQMGACVTCHAVKDIAGHPVSYEDPKHFCRVCHDYTAVKIDCFECHSSKPSPEFAIGGTRQ